MSVLGVSAMPRKGQTHKVCNICGQRLALSKFGKPRSNNKIGWYFNSCLSCYRSFATDRATCNVQIGQLRKQERENHYTDSYNEAWESDWDEFNYEAGIFKGDFDKYWEGV